MRSFSTQFQALLITITLATVTGCATNTSLPKPQSPDNFSLRTKAFRPNNAVALYVLEPDGTLRFAGGLDALNDKTTWAGRVTEKELQQLRSLLAERNWFRQPPASKKQSESHRTIVELRRIDTQRRFTVYGDNEIIQPIMDVLEKAARRRHESFLQRLPEPGPQPDYQ